MAGPTVPPPREYPSGTTDYLAHRLDGARDLYLLAWLWASAPKGPRRSGE